VFQPSFFRDPARKLPREACVERGFRAGKCFDWLLMGHPFSLFRLPQLPLMSRQPSNQSMKLTAGSLAINF
jgi:hypothetical protein